MSVPIKSFEITSESEFLRRRLIVKSLGLAPAALMAGGCGAPTAQAAPVSPGGEPLTPDAIVTGFNNFYEFGTGKQDPARYAHELTVEPWQVKVGGLADRTGTFDFDDVIKGFEPEERIYRFRCVEAWSMVVPWLGIPLGQILQRFEPHSDARYVEFTTLYRPGEMRGQRSLFSGIEWPYVEGLRLDEAMHPLTIMAVGVYGKPLPNQNGAPWRLIVPWKYGFKSIKSVVKVRFTRNEPKNTWQLQNPREYGFYANVNPAVDHPRWSQATERRLPSSLLEPNRIPTLPFNGYGEEVAGLYAGMDLTRYI